MDINKEFQTFSQLLYSDSPDLKPLDYIPKNSQLMKQISSILYRKALTLVSLSVLESVLIVCRVQKQIENENISAVYATVYLQFYSTQADLVALKNKHGNRFKYDFVNKIAYSYFTLGYSYSSADGEYRNYLQNFWTVNKVLESTFYSDMTSFAFFFRNKFKLNLIHYVFGKNLSEAKLTNIQKSLFENKIPNMLFTIHFLFLLDLIQRKMLFSQINNNYQRVFNIGTEKQTLRKYKWIFKMFKFIEKKHSSAFIRQIQMTLYHKFARHTDFLVRVDIGLKVLPVPVAAKEMPLNLKNKSWREVVFTWQLSNLVFNNVTPHLPILFTINYSEGELRTVFDSENIHLLIEKHDIATQILNYLNQCKYILHTHKSDTSESRFQQRVQTYMNQISANITTTQDYMKNRVLFSSNILTMIMSHNGHTLFYYLHKYRSSQQIRTFLSNLFENLTLFKKFVFTVLYTLTCMYSRFGVLHGDLHLSNITIQKCMFSFQDTSDLVDQYTTHNATYYLPFTNFVPTIIDFSRIYTLYPKKVAMIVPIENVPENMPNLTHLMKWLFTTYPTLENQQSDILRIIAADISVCYYATCLSDFYNFLTKLTKVHIVVTKMLPPKTKIYDFLMEMIHFIDSFILTFFKNKLAQKHIDTTLPFEIVCSHFFKEFTIKPKASKVVCSYNINNKLILNREDLPSVTNMHDELQQFKEEQANIRMAFEKIQFE